ncbi:MAG: aldo/keto reductase [Rhodospirillaceae bacterium]
MAIDLKASATVGHGPWAVPPMGLGCVFLGDPDGPTDEDHMQRTLAAAWDGGLRYFDTSPWYGNTKSEHRLGYFLRQKPRADFTVATKVGRVYFRPDDPAAYGDSRWMQRWKGGLPFDLRFDYTRDGVLRSYEDSLTRMGLNRIDALAIHDLDLKHNKGWAAVTGYLDQLSEQGGYRALRDLKDAGEIQAIGVGVNHTGMIPAFLERFEIDYFLVAMPYTLLDQPALDGEFQMCAEAGSSVVIGAVFASGILATGSSHPTIYNDNPPPDEVVERVRAIEAVCADHGVSLRAAALQFPLAHPVVAAVIPGADTPERVRENLVDARTTVPDAFWTDLRDAGLIRADAPLP